jgi:hypothetical protein
MPDLKPGYNLIRIGMAASNRSEGFAKVLIDV